MSTTRLSIFSFLLIAGCTSFDTLDEGLPLLRGKDIKEAIAYLGIPEREYEIAGQKVYVWSTSQTNPFSTTTITTTTGSVGYKPFQAMSTTVAPQYEALGCTIKAITANSIIQTFNYEGNNGPCYVFAKRLKPLLATKRKR